MRTSVKAKPTRGKLMKTTKSLVTFVLGLVSLTSVAAGPRVISINFSDNSSRNLATDGDCSGALYVDNNVAGWNNVVGSAGAASASGLVMWNGSAAESVAELAVQASGNEFRQGNTSKGFPAKLQAAMIYKTTSVVVTNVPFARYDVLIYCYTRQYNSDYGSLAAANVNGVSWTYDSESGEMVEGTGVWNTWSNSNDVQICTLAEPPTLGHNLLRVANITGSTLTITKGGNSGDLCIAAVQIVENAVKTVTDADDVSDLNAQRGDDTMISFVPAADSVFTIDTTFDGIEVVVGGEGTLTVNRGNSISDADFAATIAKFDFSHRDGTVVRTWGRRIVSINFGHTNNTTQTMNAQHCDGPFYAVNGDSWLNIDSAELSVEQTAAIWDCSIEQASSETVSVLATADKIDPANSDYPTTLQRGHARSVNVTVSNVPFLRYDVILYYATQYRNESYGKFKSALVNGNTWTWDSVGGAMVMTNANQGGAWNLWTPAGYESSCANRAEAPILGHNTLVIAGETSETLTIAKNSSDGNFYLGGIQVVEKPVPTSDAGMVSGLNAALGGNTAIAFTPAGNAILTIDELFTGEKIIAAGKGRLLIERGDSISDADLQATAAKIDVSRWNGETVRTWGKRVLSINFCGSGSGTKMSGDGEGGYLAGTGIPASSWNNVSYEAPIGQTDLVYWDGRASKTIATNASVVALATKHSPSDYPAPFQQRAIDLTNDVNVAGITVENVPFAKYDVIIYLATSNAGTTFGYFESAKVNGVDWTWNPELQQMVQGSEGRWNDPDNHKAAPQIGLNALIIPKVTGSTLTISRNHIYNGNFRVCALQIVDAVKVKPPAKGLVILLK